MHGLIVLTCNISVNNTMFRNEIYNLIISVFNNSQQKMMFKRVTLFLKAGCANAMMHI